MKKDFPEKNPHIQESPDDDIIDEEVDGFDTGPRIPNQTKNVVEMEPEREPEFNNVINEGNVTCSILDKEGAIGSRMIQGTNIPNPNIRQEEGDSMEASLNLSKTNDSISEMKKDTNIPILKNSEHFLNKGQITNFNRHPNDQFKVRSFATRVNSTDPYKVAFSLVADINLVSSQVFQLWHKLIEIITINPKFVCEWLRMQNEEKMRE